MQKEMVERTDYESEAYAQLVERFTQENERYLLLGGDNYEAEIERTLTGLGFSREDFERPTKEFSGGWRMRIELAKILLRKPKVLGAKCECRGFGEPRSCFHQQCHQPDD